MKSSIPLTAKILFSIFMVIWIPTYWIHYGPQQFLWYCDIANFVILVAIWLESPLLFSWQAVSILLPQLLFVFDLISRLILGKHLIGGTEYMFDESASLGIRLLSLFHAVNPFILIYALWRFGYDLRGLKYQLATATFILPISYFFFSPELDINWVWGLYEEPQTEISPNLFFLIAVLGYPVLIYLPTHYALKKLFKRVV